MSFSSQKAVYYIIDEFNNWLLIVGTKMPVVLKR